MQNILNYKCHFYEHLIKIYTKLTFIGIELIYIVLNHNEWGSVFSTRNKKYQIKNNGLLSFLVQKQE